jgi:hypothetical protein
MNAAPHRKNCQSPDPGRITFQDNGAGFGQDHPTHLNQSKELKTMLWTIAIILIVLWALGLFTHVAGGLIHLLLVIAIIVIVVNLVRGRRIF